MERSIIISGFGGQGVLFAGQLLAYAAMDSGLHVTWIPSYGPEMRGGTANCTVIIGDEPIGAPTVAHPDIAVALNQPSMDKYLPLVKPDGLLIVNSSLVTTGPTRGDIRTVMIKANEIAERHGSVQMANMAAVGCMLWHLPVLSLDALAAALRNHLPQSKAHLLEANIQVLRHASQEPLAVQ